MADPLPIIVMIWAPYGHHMGPACPMTMFHRRTLVHESVPIWVMAWLPKDVLDRFVGQSQLICPLTWQA